MNDISEILLELLDKYSNTRDLDDAFQEMLRADDELHNDYNTWCLDHGYSKNSGFRDFINEIMESQDSYWDNYRDFDN